MLTLDDFDYHLPEHLIAQHPPAERGQSRLLVVGTAGTATTPRMVNTVQALSSPSQQINTAAGTTGTPPQNLVTGGLTSGSGLPVHNGGISPAACLSDRRFSELPLLLRPDDLLVFNNTKVIHARLFATKSTGGRVEIMVERVLDSNRVLAMLRASHAPKAGAVLQLDDWAEVTVLQREGMMYTLALNSQRPDLPTALDIIEHAGQLPLPPYITHTPTAEDEARYQTVYASQPGAVAAPTAGLHFTEALLDELHQRGIRRTEITLHVGAGTFQPVKVHDISQHTMHSERYFLNAAAVDALRETRERGGRIVAVGTTSLRALESWAWNDAAVSGDTDIFITPGYRFSVVDALITNFHLPRSTLLMLVSALAGMDTIRQAYAHAVANEYRFFSYGDAMLLERMPNG